MEKSRPGRNKMAAPVLWINGGAQNNRNTLIVIYKADSMREKFRKSSFGLLAGLYLAAALMFTVFCETKAQADAVPRLSEARFSEELLRITRSYRAVRSSGNKWDPYINARLIVKNTDPYLDPELYGATEAIQNEDGVYILQFDSIEQAKAAEAALQNLETTIYVEPDFPIFTGSDMDQSYDDAKDWNINMMNFREYIEYLKDQNLDTRIVVAVLDTGISFSHPLLSGRLLKNQAISFAPDFEEEWDPDEDRIEPARRMAHGTHVAGIIARCTEGLNVDILPVRILTSISKYDPESQGEGTLASFGYGLLYAVFQGANVINISVGGMGEASQYMEECVQKAVSSGAVVVVSAGNQNNLISWKGYYTDYKVLPAYISQCITVGSLDSDMNRLLLSNYGTELDVMAPGEDIWSSTVGRSGPDNGFMSGTSMASPHVAAMAALLQMAYRNYSPEQIERLIQENALDLGQTGNDIYYGYGLARFEPLLKRTVSYVPGTHGRFPASTFSMMYGSKTPAAPDLLGEPGYIFTGWFPALSDRVRNNVVYTAQWAVDPNSLPKTGDSMNLTGWIILALSGLLGLAWWKKRHV